MTAGIVIRRGGSVERRPWPRIGLLLAPIGVLFLLLLIVPLVLVLILSFADRNLLSGGPVEIGLMNYAAFFTDRYQLTILLSTLRIGLLCTVICLVIAYPLAYFMTRTGPRVRNLLILGTILPFLISGVIRVFAWVVLLARDGVFDTIARAFGLPTTSLGLVNTEAGVIFGLVYILLPYPVFVLYSAFEKIPVKLEEAASSLGAGAWSRLRRVLLPLSVPGLISGGSIVFAVAVSSFIVPQMLGGPSNRMVATEVYTQAVELVAWPKAATIATVLVVIVILITLGSSAATARLGRTK